MRLRHLLFVIAAFAISCGLLNMYHASAVGAHPSSFAAASESTKLERKLNRVEMSVTKIVQTLKIAQGQLPALGNLSMRIHHLEKTVAELSLQRVTASSQIDPSQPSPTVPVMRGPPQAAPSVQLQPSSAKAVLPRACSVCKPGAGVGGVILEGGVCKAFCSKAGYCGDSKPYQAGTDCMNTNGKGAHPQHHPSQHQPPQHQPDVGIAIQTVIQHRCSNCKAGGPEAGSVHLEGGICKAFCSTSGFCGYGRAYSNGIDCRQLPATQNPRRLWCTGPTPAIVIISSVRVEYTKRLLDSLPPNITSPRFMLVDDTLADSPKSNLDALTALANRHAFKMVVFNQTMNATAKKATRTSSSTQDSWYTMVATAFSQIGQNTDVLFLEDDVVLSPDALTVACVLFDAKRNDPDVHGIALGGWSGEHLINAQPDTLAVRLAFNFQGMAYGIDRRLFAFLQKRRQLVLLNETLSKQAAIHKDWTTAIPMYLGLNLSTGKATPAELVLLVPTMGRMYHIGAVGLGQDGNGKRKRHIPPHPPWFPYSNFTHNASFTILPERRDVYGFVCNPLRTSCKCRNGGPDELFPTSTRLLWPVARVHAYCISDDKVNNKRKSA